MNRAQVYKSSLLAHICTKISRGRGQSVRSGTVSCNFLSLMSACTQSAAALNTSMDSSQSQGHHSSRVPHRH